MTTSTLASARAYSGHSSELNELMSFGHVVISDGAGNVTDEGDMPYGSEVVHLTLDDDGQSLDDAFIDAPPGWKALTGFTGQDRYNGPVLHTSEFIGGGLESHIRENAGYYVAAIVDGMYDREEQPDDEDLNIGWTIFHATPETVRLESIRRAIRLENVSYGELAELQSLAEHIDAGDVELLEWAGVPEGGE